MFGLQSVKGEHVRQDRTAGHAGDEVGDRVAAPLRVEQIHHHHGERVVDGGKIVGGAGHQEQPHREPLQDRGGSAHVLRGKAAVLSSQRMVPTYTGDQKYDQESVQVLLYYLDIYRGTRHRDDCNDSSIHFSICLSPLHLFRRNRIFYSARSKQISTRSIFRESRSLVGNKLSLFFRDSKQSELISKQTF